MSRRQAPVDVGVNPDLARLVEEVADTGQPRLLRTAGDKLALLVPVRRGTRAHALRLALDTGHLPPVPHRTIAELVAGRPHPTERTFTDEELAAAIEEERAARWRLKS